MSFEAFFAAVREAARPAIWSDGVQLAREQAVRRVKRSEDERVFRVRAPGVPIDPTVTLYPLDEEWSCTCPGPADPCAHVVAATIASKQGSDAPETEENTENPEENVLGSVAYALRVQSDRLHLTRALRAPDGSVTPWAGYLSSAIAQRKLPSWLSPTHADLLIDRASEGRAEWRVPLHELSKLFEALRGHPHVTLDGAAIELRGEPIKPHGRISDRADGFLLQLFAPDDLQRVIARGVGQRAGALHPLGSLELAGERFEQLPRSERFARRDGARWVSQVLPGLQSALDDLQIDSAHLPKATRRLLPRLTFDISHQDGVLIVLPQIVYGDPAVARLEGDQLVAFGGEAPQRRREEEAALALALRDALHLVVGRKVDFRGAEAARMLQQLREFAEKHGQNAPTLQSAQLGARLELGDAQGELTLAVHFESEDGRARADADAVLSAWHAGLSLVPLLDGGIAELPRDWLARHGAHIAELLAARDAQGRVPKVLAGEVKRLCDELTLPPPASLQSLLQTLAFAEDGSLQPAELPSDLRAELRDYQQRGVAWLQGLQKLKLGALLADDMGLGKTLQAACVLRGRCLIVCPKSVVFNWQSELARFRPSLRVHVHERGELPSREQTDVILLTYARLRLDLEALEKETFDVVVLDEAQAIKNPDSQSAQAAYKLHAEFRLILSGTPIENRLEELWSLSHFAVPGLLGSRTSFRARFAEPVAAGRSEASAQLRARMRPYLLRRSKGEVLSELPQRSDCVEWVQLSEQERAHYDAVKLATKQQVLRELDGGTSTLAILEALLRLRQAACHSGLVPGVQAQSSSKLERLVEQLDSLRQNGHRALVFSQWTSLLDKLEPLLLQANLRFLRIDGKTQDRGAQVEQFQRDDGPEVLLLSLKAGGTGLNLTAADHVFLLDPWWNPAVEDQAADRAHRIGQTRPVLLHRMVARDTVEERVLALQAQKRALAEAALGDGSAGAAITRDELLALLE